MKLQQKINIRYSIFSVIVFLFAGILLFVTVKVTVHENIDDVLRSREDGVQYYLRNHTVSDSGYQSPDYTIIIQPYQGKHFSRLKDTLAYDFEKKRLRHYREYSFSASDRAEKLFKVDILQSKLESDDLFEVIFYFMLGLMVVMILVLFILNRKIYKSIWKPFFETLDQLKSFKIGGTREINLPLTSTDEFDILNQTLNDMTSKLQADYLNLKEFTENASHEIQTPLAVIKSKLEKTLHSENLPEIHRDSVYSAYEATIRLSKLNESLLLLSKIENRQFAGEEEIDLKVFITTWLRELDELIQLKKIRTKLINPSPFPVKMNQYLATILINNLAGNALKHCPPNGRIRISFTENAIEFSNPGQPLLVPPEKLFKRFSKQSTGSESTGLGLAIAREICNRYGFGLNYIYKEGNHTFILSRNQFS